MDDSLIRPSFNVPLIDLVAVAYNAPEETMRFLTSVAEHIDVPFTLTVIDNNSPDARTRAVLKQGINLVAGHELFQGGRLDFSEENLGYARACNLGATYGDAPVIGLLNCDVQWTPNVGRQIFDALHYDWSGVEPPAVVGPKTVTYESHPLHRPKLTHSGIVRTAAGNDNHRFWMAPDVGQADDVVDVPTVSGATYFIRREVWRKLTECPDYQAVAPGAEGAFLPTRHYYEETFCSYHARAHGYRVAYRGDITMIHEWHKSSVVGGIGEQIWSQSEQYFRRACEAHGIELSF